MAIGKRSIQGEKINTPEKRDSLERIRKATSQCDLIEKGFVCPGPTIRSS